MNIAYIIYGYIRCTILFTHARETEMRRFMTSTLGAILVLAGHRDHEWVGTGRQQQAIVISGGTVVGDDLFLYTVDLRNGLALVQGNAIVAVPSLVVEHDVVNGLFTGQHR